MKTLNERFFSKIALIPFHDCWEWIGNKYMTGYGQFRVGKTQQYAHRVSWGIHFGSIPAKMQVCHKCDNPPCVNPAHLFLGTIKDNALDRERKGRGRNGGTLRITVGERCGTSKLTQSQVDEIRRRSADGEKVYLIHRDFSFVNRTTLYKIVHRLTWNIHTELSDLEKLRNAGVLT